MLSLLVVGARVSLLVGFAAAAVSAVIGGDVGLLSGFFGGKTDTVLMRITDYFLVIPEIPLMIVVAALFGRSLTNIILIIGLIYWTSTARLLRAQTKSVRERVYVRRARSLGAGNTRLILKHVLPQVTPLLIANTVLLVAYAIFAETFITFLGLGDPSLVSWGRLIENAFTDDAILNNAWWAIVPPGLAVTIVVLACTMTGQAIEDSLNPRLRGRATSPWAAFGMRPLPRTGCDRSRASALLEVDDLHVWFDLGGGASSMPSRASSFAVDAGERLGLVGESGSGKTTTILALMGLLPPTASAAGRVLLNGENILAARRADDRPHRWRDVAMVFQGAMNAFNPVKTHRRPDRRADGAARYRARAAARGQRAGELLERVGIPAARGRALSARVLGRHAAARRDRDGARLRAEAAARRRADHRARRDGAGPDPRAADRASRTTSASRSFSSRTTCRWWRRSATRAAVMYAGEIVESGPVDELYHDPRHPYTRLLFAATPDLLGDERRRLDPRRAAAARPRDPRAVRSRRAATGPSRPAPHGHAAAPQVAGGHEAACHLNDRRWSRSIAMSDAWPARRCSRSKGLVDRYPVAARDRRRRSRVQPKQCVHAVDGRLASRSAPARCVALVGESGCGKTTTAQSVLRLVDAGCRRRSGSRPRHHALSNRELRPLRRRMQIIYQDPYESLDPRFRVAATVEEPLLVHGIGAREERHERVARGARAGRALAARAVPRPLSRTSCPAASVNESRSRRASCSIPSCSSPTSRSRCSTSRFGPASSPLLDELRDERLGDPHDHARPLDGGPLRRPDRGHVPGPDRRGGPGARGDRNPQHPYTQALLSVVPQRDPRRSVSRRSSRGETPNPIARAVGLPLPPALPGCGRRVPHDRPGLRAPAGVSDGHRAACTSV